MDDDPDRKSEEVVNLPHPFGVALGQIIVDRHHMNATAGDRIEIDRKSRNQRFAFAGLHFRYFAFVQDYAADKLDVEMTLAQRSLRRFPDGGEGRNQNVIERDAFRDLLLEFVGPRFQRIVRKAFQFLFERVDLANPGQIAADAALVGGSKQLAGNGADHTGELLTWPDAYITPPRPDLPPAFRNAALFGQIRRERVSK